MNNKLTTTGVALSTIDISVRCSDPMKLLNCRNNYSNLFPLFPPNELTTPLHLFKRKQKKTEKKNYNIIKIVLNCTELTLIDFEICRWFCSKKCPDCQKRALFLANLSPFLSMQLNKNTRQGLLEQCFQSDCFPFAGNYTLVRRKCLDKFYAVWLVCATIYKTSDGGSILCPGLIEAIEIHLIWSGAFLPCTFLSISSESITYLKTWITKQSYQITQRSAEGE